MKISIYTKTSGDDTYYITVLSGKDITINIPCGKNDPTRALTDAVDKAANGIGSNLGPITITPLGEKVMISINTETLCISHVSDLASLEI